MHAFFDVDSTIFFLSQFQWIDFYGTDNRWDGCFCGIFMDFTEGNPHFL